jgi:hypothetical protein
VQGRQDGEHRCILRWQREGKEEEKEEVKEEEEEHVVGEGLEWVASYAGLLVALTARVLRMLCPRRKRWGYWSARRDGMLGVDLHRIHCRCACYFHHQ